MAQIVAGADEVGLGGLERGAGAVARRERVVEGVLRDGTRGDELLMAGVAELGVAERRLALRDLGLGVLHRSLIFDGVETIEQIAGLDARAVLERNLEDLARDLGDDVDLRDRDDTPRISTDPTVGNRLHLDHREGDPREILGPKRGQREQRRR